MPAPAQRIAAVSHHAFGENHQRLSVTAATAALVQMEMPLGTRMLSSLMENELPKPAQAARFTWSCIR